MIKFFRRIRQKLLSENKFSKYLLYAIGEIILVVIGILIALQINTWNEKRLQRKKERAVLTEMQDDLQKNIQEFKVAIANENRIIQNINDIIAEIKKDNSNFARIGEKLVSTSWSEEISYASTSYKQLNTLGAELISNDSLRRAIVALYDVEYPKIKERVKAYSSNHFNSLVTPIIIEYLRIDSLDIGHIINPEQFKEDPKVLNVLGDRRYWKKGVVGFNEFLVEKTEELNTMISKELEKQ